MTPQIPQLAIVMPVYNEETVIRQVVEEWLSNIRVFSSETGHAVCLIVVDDGSKDSSNRIIRELCSQAAELILISKPNSGHGQSCVRGYQHALELGCPWVLQVDSDGQCDPSYLKLFWAAREKGASVQGFRTSRGDGLARLMISRVLSLVIFLLSFKTINDPNVPYRLMDHDSLKALIQHIPDDFYLANILLSYLFETEYKIKWIKIDFKERAGGVTHANFRRTVLLAKQFVLQFNLFKKNFRGLRL